MEPEGLGFLLGDFLLFLGDLIEITDGLPLGDLSTKSMELADWLVLRTGDCSFNSMELDEGLALRLGDFLLFLFGMGLSFTSIELDEELALLLGDFCFPTIFIDFGAALAFPFDVNFN